MLEQVVVAVNQPGHYGQAGNIHGARCGCMGFYPGCGSDGQYFPTGNGNGPVTDKGVSRIHGENITPFEEYVCDLPVSFHQYPRVCLTSRCLRSSIGRLRSSVRLRSSFP